MGNGRAAWDDEVWHSNGMPQDTHTHTCRLWSERKSQLKVFSYPVKIIMRFCEIVEAGGQKQMFVLLLQFSTRRQDTHTYTHTHTCTGFDSWHPWLRWSKTFVKLVFSFLSALLCGYNSLWTTMSTLVLIIICLCDEVLMFVLVKEMRRTLRKKKYIYIYIDMVN